MPATPGAFSRMDEVEPAEDRAVIDARQQDQGRRRIADTDGHGDHDGDDRHRPEAGQHADERTYDAAHHNHDQVERGDGRSKADQDTFKHLSSPYIRNPGQGRRKIPSTSWTRYQIDPAAMAATGIRM